MSRWFRHYGGMMRDEKLVSAAVKSKQSVERVVWVYGAVLESASEINDGGRYDLDPAEAAYFLRCDSDDVTNILGALESLGRLDQGVVVKWSDRQFESDTSAERTREYRARRAAGNKVPERGESHSGDSDAAVTSPNESVTPPDTESDTERKIARDAHDDFWEVCPKKVGKGASKKAWKSAILKTSPDTIIAAMRAFASKQAGKDEKYIPHPASWLSAERWQDADLQPLITAHGNDLETPVLLDTPAWNEWKKVKPHIVPRDIRCPDGRIRQGRYFPSEFPPILNEQAA